MHGFLRENRPAILALASLAVCCALAKVAGAQQAQLVITGAHVVTGNTPEEVEERDAGVVSSRPTTIVVRGGRIAEIYADLGGPPPPAERVIDGRGKMVTPGFWNCHVHFTEPKWSNAGEQDAAALAQHLRDMVTSHGFTSVVDAGSDPVNTLALRRRIEAGLPGPRIVLAGGSFVGEKGSPAYLEVKLPEVTTENEAQSLTREVLDQGADHVKIFTGSYVGTGPAVVMLLPVVQAVTAEAHSQDKLVFAHPQTLEGVQLALDGGVDVLAHTAPQGGAWSPELVKGMVEKGMSLIPTLKLWRFELTRAKLPPVAVDRAQATAVRQLGVFAKAGGDILFGTDLGYMTDYDPTEEYQRMAEAGMSFHQILSSLTTNPARRFDDPAARGVVEVGMAADLVVLGSDNAWKRIESLADVSYTIRAGRVIYERQ